jgi:cytochrome c551/c552
MSWSSRRQMKLAAPMLAAILCAALRPALAEDPARAFRLAEEKGCFECHAIGWKLVGPAFTDVAARYRFDPQARELLVDKVRFGGKQHWGERFNMWPQTNLSDEETYVLVDWVLSQRP